MINIKKQKKFSDLFKYFFEKRMMKILLLGAISGFPWVIIGSSLSLWLKEEGLSRSTIVDLDNPSSCLLYTSPSPRDQRGSRMPSSA